MNTATAATARADVLTLEKMQAALRKLDELDQENARMAGMAAGLFSPFGGPRVVESPLVGKDVPARPHKRRRNQSEAYHRRIQKKWAKRYGTKRESCVLMVDGSRFGLGPMLVLHPADAQRLRQHMASLNARKGVAW